MRAEVGGGRRPLQPQQEAAGTEAQPSPRAQPHRKAKEMLLLPITIGSQENSHHTSPQSSKSKAVNQQQGHTKTLHGERVSWLDR